METRSSIRLSIRDLATQNGISNADQVANLLGAGGFFTVEDLDHVTEDDLRALGVAESDWAKLVPPKDESASKTDTGKTVVASPACVEVQIPSASLNNGPSIRRMSPPITGEHLLVIYDAATSLRRSGKIVTMLALLALMFSINFYVLLSKVPTIRCSLGRDTFTALIIVTCVGLAIVCLFTVILVGRFVVYDIDPMIDSPAKHRRLFIQAERLERLVIWLRLVSVFSILLVVPGSIVAYSCVSPTTMSDDDLQSLRAQGIVGFVNVAIIALHGFLCVSVYWNIGTLNIVLNSDSTALGLPTRMLGYETNV